MIETTIICDVCGKHSINPSDVEYKKFIFHFTIPQLHDSPETTNMMYFDICRSCYTTHKDKYKDSMAFWRHDIKESIESIVLDSFKQIKNS